ncbi:hypothetical protein SAMN05421504_101998 [Amycolatopsis xylanica]|uniref:Uncharacterized protein n=1 Tax=Amycolatopsis xylanica TaxID=589385 RepID=A0A1H2UTL7_9PSEU|nr:hypothetical protein [Amycolatopsis xylanica]SDW59451.1 hypothetical protein SAMN05421504_101998 [Amycolatopsis xylanica]
MPAAVWTGRNSDLDMVTADISRALATELGLGSSPLAVTLSAESDGVPAGSLLPPRERFSGMPAPTHCFVYVDAPAPRPFELRASIMSGRSGLRRSVGLGQLLYAVPLAISVPSRVSLGASGFEGEPAITGLLTPLLATADALAVTKAGPDLNHTWQVERLLAIEPLPQGALLVVRTLHRPSPGGWVLSSKAVLDFAARAEAALG